LKRSATRRITIILLLFFSFPLRAADNEPNWETVQRELVSLLQDLIRADTRNPPGNEIRACQILRRFFKREGISSRVYEVDDSRANLLARLKGDGSQQAILLSAHTDVVPVDRENWSAPPFSGEIRDGYIYGRGAVDDKGRLAVNAMTLVLLKKRKVPLRRDIIFLAAAGEETGGAKGVGWMLERHRDKLDAAFALNEGGRIITSDGKPLYIAVETEEKIAYNITLTSRGTTGHASVPRLDNAIYASARALDRLSRYSSPKRLDDVTCAFFRGINGLDPAVQLVNGEVVTEDPLYLAMMTNTISPTFIEGGVKSNVHPPVVTVNLNCRLLPGQDLRDFVSDLEAWIAPGPYEFAVPRPVSVPDPSTQNGLGFLLIEQVCGEMFPDVPVLPYLSPGMSDATRFRREGIPTYGLLPFPLDQDEVKRMHGTDERLSVESLMTGMKLTYRLAELAGR
jgi:acetylornithine deacetylase/succinyl-diaminopimelate desuccinylase-like protein